MKLVLKTSVERGPTQRRVACGTGKVEDSTDSGGGDEGVAGSSRKLRERTGLEDGETVSLDSMYRSW